MAKTGTTTQGLRAAIERSGYYPALVAEAVEAAVGGEPIASYLVHQETTFDANEVRRHVTVLVLTGTRFIVSHTDEQAADASSPTPYATTSTESVKLPRISSVVVSRVVANPESYTPGTLPREVVLTIGWGAVSRIDLEPAACGDPNCDADHGYTGSSTADDLSLRVSEAGDGPETVRQTLAFAQALSEATAATPPLRADGPLRPRLARGPVPLALAQRARPRVRRGLARRSAADARRRAGRARPAPRHRRAGPRRPGLRLPDRRPRLGAAQGPPGGGPVPHLAPRQARSAAPAARSPRASPRPPPPPWPPSAPGCRPARHGLPGYTARNPATGELMNQLRWKPWTSPQRLAAVPDGLPARRRGRRAHRQVSSPAFQHTPLTKVALSGGTFHGRLTGEERMDFAAEQLAAGDRSLVYTYYSELDGKGHRFGVDSDAWRGQLMYVDRLVQRLAEQLPPRSALYVTADHGMIDIPFDEESRIDFDEDWELRRRRRPAGRRGPGPARLRGPGSGGRRAGRLARGARRPVLGGEPGRGDRGGLVRPAGVDERVLPAYRRRRRRGPRRRRDHRVRATSRTSRRWSACTAR